MYLKKFQILCVLISLIARKEGREVRVSDRWMFLYHWENKETVDLIGNVPHKPVLTCAAVVSFPIARSERKTCLPRFCLHPLRISQAFCSPLVTGQKTTAMQANQHKQKYSTVFVFHRLLSSNSIFGDKGEKTWITTTLSACPYPNFKVIPLMFLSAYLNVCFSFLKANALSIPSLLTCQLLLSFQRCWSY